MAVVLTAAVLVAAILVALLNRQADQTECDLKLSRVNEHERHRSAPHEVTQLGRVARVIDTVSRLCRTERGGTGRHDHSSVHGVVHGRDAHLGGARSSRATQHRCQPRAVNAAVAHLVAAPFRICDRQALPARVDAGIYHVEVKKAELKLPQLDRLTAHAVHKRKAEPDRSDVAQIDLSKV
eukprot:scaffold81840_cov75-Phaeocystis_antarctica.AAC.1